MLKFASIFVGLLVIFSATATSAQECTICATAVNAIENWLSSNFTETEIEQSLYFLCENIPGWEAFCEEVVNVGVPELINWIITNENGTVVCTQLGFCSSKNAIKVQKLRDNYCSGCTLLVDAIENWMEDQNTQGEIIQLVDQVCSLIPAYQPTCDALVAVGIPMIIQWIEQNEPASVICAQIGLCQSTNKEILPLKFVKKPFAVLGKTGLKDNLRCKVCTTLLTAVEGWVASGQNTEWIETQIEKFCKQSKEFSGICEAVVQFGVPELIAMLQNTDPKQACTRLGLCASKSVNLL